jgi:hypothetical protein
MDPIDPIECLENKDNNCCLHMNRRDKKTTKEYDFNFVVLAEYCSRKKSSSVRYVIFESDGMEHLLNFFNLHFHCFDDVNWNFKYQMDFSISLILHCTFLYVLCRCSFERNCNHKA